MDDPTAGLDWSMKNDEIKIVNDLRNNNTLIIVTHEPNLFKEYSSKIIYIEKGKIILSRS